MMRLNCELHVPRALIVAMRLRLSIQTLKRPLPGSQDVSIESTSRPTSARLASQSQVEGCICPSSMSSPLALASRLAALTVHPPPYPHSPNANAVFYITSSRWYSKSSLGVECVADLPPRYPRLRRSPPFSAGPAHVQLSARNQRSHDVYEFSPHSGIRRSSVEFCNHNVASQHTSRSFIFNLSAFRIPAFVYFCVYGANASVVGSAQITTRPNRLDQNQPLPEKERGPVSIVPFLDGNLAGNAKMSYDWHSSGIRVFVRASASYESQLMSTLAYDPWGEEERAGIGSLTHRLRLSLPTHGVERSALSLSTLEVERTKFSQNQPLPEKERGPVSIVPFLDG
ncbi:hypothetical protein B0H11DRAFT_1900943 [Mycena galericulata]|nr:hypothetical protein B0H11DRAFT_1900943 [Mycena galericulata]